MPIKHGPPVSDRIASAYSQLTDAASSLNAVTDDLGRSIVALDHAIRKLHLGVSTWVRLSRTEDRNGAFTLRELGYTKVSGKWGIALRTRAAHSARPEDEELEEWLFNDAPRALRVQAIDMIPDLLEQLVRDANNAKRSIANKMKQVHDLAMALNINSITPPGPK